MPVRPARTTLWIATCTAMLLAGCERSFDEKYDDNLKALTKEAETIKAETDRQITARERADAALMPDEDGKQDHGPDPVTRNPAKQHPATGSE